MTSKQTLPAQPGIAVSTSIAAGAVWPQHAEGIVVSTAIVAGGEPGLATNHVEGIVVSTSIAAGGFEAQHDEGIVVATAITAGGDAIASNHVDALVLR
jgi:hypothetical protein